MDQTLDRATEAMIAASVINGAMYLDQGQPDWIESIDLDRLNLQLNADCVLGQVAGLQAYWHLKESIGLGWLIRHGFHAPPVNGIISTSDRWELLTETWKVLIKGGRS